jgi:LEA14-like dessication related protein
MFLVSRLQMKAPAQLVLAIALLAGSIGGIQGCASLQADYDEPVVTVTSFRAVPAEGAALSFEIGLRVVNPNSEALELQGIAYTISLEGHKLITGVGKDLPVLEGYSEETFTLQASASMFQTIQLVSDLMREPKESLQYDLETKLDVGTFYPAIRVRKSGEISLQPTQ